MGSQYDVQFFVLDRLQHLVVDPPVWLRTSHEYYPGILLVDSRAISAIMADICIIAIQVSRSKNPSKFLHLIFDSDIDTVSVSISYLTADVNLNSVMTESLNSLCLACHGSFKIVRGDETSTINIKLSAQYVGREGIHPRCKP